jgi:oxygen-independent coproporphyrinogen-3 oxidase
VAAGVAADRHSIATRHVFVGGGTPTSVEPEELGRIIEALAGRFGLAAGAEVSVEANPEDLTTEVAGRLADAGFNRVSLGVQSFDGAVLRALGRRHTPEQADAALAAARSVFRSVNADLIFGTVGGRSVAGVRATGSITLLYALTMARGTALSRAVAAGAPAPDPDVQADAYLLAEAAAEAAGLVRYETSNYARPGHACIYNLITWAQGEYVAFGNGAHRHRGGERSWNVRRVDRYEERVLAGESAVSGRERLGPGSEGAGKLGRTPGCARNRRRRCWTASGPSHRAGVSPSATTDQVTRPAR